MDKGQLFPGFKWIMGLIMLYIVVIAYEYFAPLIDTTLPAAMPAKNLWVQSIFDSTKSNFLIGMLGLGVAYLFYIFVSGIPGGQQEDYPI